MKNENTLIDYLMTYGWTVIVFVIVGIVLWQSGLTF